METYTSEDALVAALRQGEAGAYEYLYKDVRQTIVYLVEFNSGTADDATDMLQEAMIVLYRNLQKPGFELSCKPTTYIYSVCRNKWFAYLKKRKKDYFDIAAFVDIPEDSPDGEASKDQQLKLAINSLDALCRQLLIYFYFDNLSLEEISRKLKLSNANTAKVRRFRCMEQLKIKARIILAR